MCTKKIVIALSLLIFAQQSLTSSQEEHCGVDRLDLKAGIMSCGGVAAIFSTCELLLIPFADVDPIPYIAIGAFGIGVSIFCCSVPYLPNFSCCKNKKKKNDIEMNLEYEDSADSTIELNNDLDNPNLIADPGSFPTGTDYGKRLRLLGAKTSNSLNKFLSKPSGYKKINDNKDSSSTSSS